MLLIPLGCRQDDVLDDMPRGEQEQGEQAEPVLLAVRSSGKGQSITLSLDVTFDEDELRSKSYTDDPQSGSYEPVLIDGEERAHCILRRKGDASATTYVDIVWKGRRDRRIKFDDLKVTLPEGVEPASGDEWYFLAIMGGDSFDMQTGRVRMTSGTSEEGQSDPQIDDASLGKIPYLMNWTKLNVNGREFATPTTAQFRPLGTLLRLQFLSNMIEDYKATSLTFTSNALDLSGVFDPMQLTDEQLSTPVSVPRWEPSQSTSPSQRYVLRGGGRASARGLELPGGTSWNRERTIYVWGMPREPQTAQEALHTEVELEVLPLHAEGGEVRPVQRKTYDHIGHRPFRHGATYRLSNVLTSDLIISEIFYDYAQPDPFASTEDKPNYSIVEIYNPTLSPVDLNHYALARLRYNEAERQYGFHKLEVDEPVAKPDEATLLQLSLIAGNGWNSTFGNRVGKREGRWRRHIYTKGNTQQILEPGQTLLIAAGGYMLRDAMPDRNIYMFDEARRRGDIQEADFAHTPGSAGYQTLQSRLRTTERAYLPHAGTQPDTAVRLGLSHTMVALENGSHPNAIATDKRGGTMQLGLGQGFALVKFVGSATTSERLPSSSSFVLTDVSLPVGSDATAYRGELLRELQGQGLQLA